MKRHEPPAAGPRLEEIVRAWTRHVHYRLGLKVLTDRRMPPDTIVAFASPEAAERFYRKMQVHDDPPEPAGGSQFCPPLTKDDTMKSIDPWNREKCGAAVVGARETHGSDERPALAHLSFGTALELLRQGEALARRGWNGRGQFIELQVPDKQSKMTLPYFYIRTVDGGLVPWLASQTDLLAHDWCVVRSAGLALVYGYSEDIGPGVVVPASQGPTGPVPARAD